MEKIEFIPLIKEGWVVLKKNFMEIFLAALIFFALTYLIPQLVQLPLTMLMGTPDSKDPNLAAFGAFFFVSIILSIFFAIVKMFASVGLTKVYLQSVDGQHQDFHYFYKHWKVVLIYFLNTLVAVLVSFPVFIGLFVLGLIIAGIPGFIVYSVTKSVGAGVGVGFLLALIPLSVLLAYSTVISFISYISIDKVWGPIEALERAFAITKGKRIRVTLITFGIGLFMISGIFLLIVGVILTWLIGMVSLTVLYRKLDKMTPVEGSPKSYA